MKSLNIVFALALVLFVGCGGESKKVRTINITGLDQMKFAVQENAEGITVGDPVGDSDMPRLVGITAKPGEKLHIKLTTKSQMPASAMSHNWLLLVMNADAEAFATAALQEKENDYVPANKMDQVIAETGLASGGNTSEVTFTVPSEPGEYQFICTFPGHFSAGMKGILTVEEPDTSM